MPQIILNQAGVMSPFSQVIATGVAEHMGMHPDGQPGSAAILTDNLPEALACQWLSPAGGENPLVIVVRPCFAFREPASEEAVLFRQEGMRGAEAALEPANL